MSAREPGTGATPSNINWPAGPHYFDLTASEGATAWVRYRLWAADWHIRTLRDLADTAGTFDRLVGIEMAIDGALNGLSSAFDAAVAMLIPAAEDTLHVDPAKRTPQHRYSWRAARDLLKQRGIGTNENGTTSDDVWRLILDTDNALDGETAPTPTGWLAQLRRLRNQVAHQDTLARHHTGSTSTVRAFNTGTDAFEHLAEAADKVHHLTEQIVNLANTLGANETRTQSRREPWNATKE